MMIAVSRSKRIRPANAIGPGPRYLLGDAPDEE